MYEEETDSRCAHNDVQSARRPVVIRATRMNLTYVYNVCIDVTYIEFG